MAGFIFGDEDTSRPRSVRTSPEVAIPPHDRPADPPSSHAAPERRVRRSAHRSEFLGKQLRRRRPLVPKNMDSEAMKTNYHRFPEPVRSRESYHRARIYRSAEPPTPSAMFAHICSSAAHSGCRGSSRGAPAITGIWKAARSELRALPLGPTSAADGGRKLPPGDDSRSLA